MYLFIHDDCVVKGVASIDDGDLLACDEGLVSIIDISTPVPKEYYNGEWSDIDMDKPTQEQDT